MSQQPSTQPYSQTQTDTTTPAPSSPRRSWIRTIWSIAQFIVAFAVTVGVLIYLLTGPTAKPEPPKEQDANDESVQVTAPFLIRVDPNTPLGNKIQIAEVQPTQLTSPSLFVTGTVVASLRPGGSASAGLTALIPWARRSDNYWQFNSPEVLTTFTDWQKAKADVAFSKGQALRIRDAAIARTAAQRELVATMIKLEAAGTETKKQLAIEQATLRQYEIQQEREIYEAETAIRVAERNEAATSRQLQQVGLDPELLASVTSADDLVMADVPEGFLSRVQVGDGCEARFFGIPNQVFTGRVKSIAPVVARERRSLRVLFTVDDLKDQLRPGMFAEIGLGTDPRNALLAPADGVIHVGRTDYLLVATADAGVWRTTPVEVGEIRQGRVEVIKGLHAGDRVIGQGAILLKPAVVKAVHSINGGLP